MRSPRLAVLATLIIWIVFGMALIALALWRVDISFGNPHSLIQLILILALVAALVQTRFLLKNMRVSFAQPDTDQYYKPKHRPKNDLLELVNRLDESERAELYGMLGEQAQDRSDYHSP